VQNQGNALCIVQSAPMTGVWREAMEQPKRATHNGPMEVSNVIDRDIPSSRSRLMYRPCCSTDLPGRNLETGTSQCKSTVIAKELDLNTSSTTQQEPTRFLKKPIPGIRIENG
jgi:hypothetical protein